MRAAVLICGLAPYLFWGRFAFLKESYLPQTPSEQRTATCKIVIASKNGPTPVFTSYHYFASVASLAGGLGDTSLLEEKYPPEDVGSTFDHVNIQQLQSGDDT